MRVLAILNCSTTSLARYFARRFKAKAPGYKLLRYSQHLKVDDEGNIIDSKFKTFGCGSAIASSSLATEWVKGRSVDDAVSTPTHMHRPISPQCAQLYIHSCPRR